MIGNAKLVKYHIVIVNVNINKKSKKKIQVYAGSLNQSYNIAVALNMLISKLWYGSETRLEIYERLLKRLPAYDRQSTTDLLSNPRHTTC